MDINNISELQHYGILGMKWGVRRAKNRVFARGSNRNEISIEAYSGSSTSRGKKYAKRALTSAIAGASVGALTSYTFKVSPKKAVRNMLGGALAGVTVTAVVESAREMKSDS